MTDRFDAQLRQHLLGTANERPADGQVATIVGQVAVTRQRRALPAWLTRRRGPIGPLASDAVRLGFVVLALVLATLAVIVVAGGTQSPASTVFAGTWTTIDVPDGSTMNLYVGEGDTPTVRFEDLFATGTACLNDEVKVYTAVGVGVIDGDHLEATFPNGGGCGLETVSIAGSYVYDPDADTLIDQDGLVWTRVRGGDGPITTLPPGPSPSLAASTVFEGRWTATDPGDDSTLTLIVGEGVAPTVQFQDDRSTGGVCDADEVKIFRADGVGEITGNRLLASYPDGGGCGSKLVAIGGRYDLDAESDTLVDQDGVSWSRVPLGADPLPTLWPIPTQPPPTLHGGCTDLTNGGTYRGFVGNVTLTAIVPGTPVVPWYGSRAGFEMAGSCVDGSPMAFHAMPTTDVGDDSSCYGGSAPITDFADAIARLDTPRGNDISDRIDLTIDGYPAARYDVVNLSACAGFGLWGGTILGPGETGSIYVIDVDGTLVEIELNRDGSQTRKELEEAYAIIASLQIEP
jgi:hypothetical protein